MRVMMMHKSDKAMETGAQPSLEVIAGMGGLVGEMTKVGAFLAGEGLGPTSAGVRLKFTKGERTVTRGPFIGGNELTADITIVRVRSLDAAVEWASRLAEIAGDAELDVRPLKEPWDLGVMPMPAGLETTRYMIIHKADATSEAGATASQTRRRALARLADEMRDAGVLVTTESLQPSTRGVRIRYADGVGTVTDGPFSESKELIAGFMLIAVEALPDAVEWTAPFARLIGDVEIDLRPVYEPSDLNN